ncbi:WhiB family transcriptional regulator [Glutamicibacter sp. NPDC087344]|uniref:WhiB family transcriptional regulator n=1 Tax=Glutamicibacter sp. NPDC087344 TaxID=3363994 RepID=UPI00381811BD
MIQQAPDISTDPSAWMDEAACAVMARTWNFRKDGDPFFPISKAPFAAEPAKKICATCPVMSICYEHGEETGNSQNYGIYGGLDEQQRKNRRRLKRHAEANEKKKARTQ